MKKTRYRSFFHVIVSVISQIEFSMKFKLWWHDMDDQEKANRSFLFIPFSFLFLLLPDTVKFLVLDRYIITAIVAVVLLIQGIYYLLKAKRNTNNDI
mgnify:CR=1 FL=1